MWRMTHWRFLDTEDGPFSAYIKVAVKYTVSNAVLMVSFCKNTYIKGKKLMTCTGALKRMCEHVYECTHACAHTRTHTLPPTNIHKKSR